MIKVLTITDNLYRKTELIKHLSDYNNISVVGSLALKSTYLELIEDLNIQVLYMDIHQYSKDWRLLTIELLERFPKMLIVWVATDEKYAYEAFEIGIFDYLAYPLHKDRMDASLVKLERSLAILEPLDSSTSNQRPKIKCFGTFSLQDQNNELIRWRTRKAKELFIYLWINSEISIDRDILIETMYPEVNYDKASSRLSTTLYQLRNSLKESFSGETISYINNGYKVLPKISSDYEHLLNILDRNSITIQNYYKIKKIYKSKFLEFEGYAWSERYASMIDSKVKKFLSLLLFENKDSLDIIVKEDILLFLYSLDQSNENVVLEILELYYLLTNIEKLEKFYQDYRNQIAEVLSLSPSIIVSKTYRSFIKVLYSKNLL